MGLLSKKKKTTVKTSARADENKPAVAYPDEKLFDKTVMMYFALFTDINPNLAVAVNRDLSGQQKRIAEEHIIDIVKCHYYVELQPPVVWNFNCVVTVIPCVTDPGQKAIVKFWDDATGEIIDKAKYLQICSELRSEWRGSLVNLYPNYNRDKLEDGYENTNFDYYPEEGLLACTMLLEKLLPLM